VSSLGLLSFKLHKELADAHNGSQIWGYTPSTCISLTQSDEEAVGGSGEDWLDAGTSRANASTAKAVKDGWVDAPPWLKKVDGGSLEVISEVGTTAQMYVNLRETRLRA
jgi:hypothetical protein